MEVNQTENKPENYKNRDEECIENCLDCHHVCLDMAFNHCLEIGGKHAEPEHIRLMMTCAEVCLSCANLQSIGGKFSLSLCGVCADICEECAESCKSLGKMDKCEQACRKCAESCRQMNLMA